MLISLNWLRDFVELPVDLDAHELAERFTRTTAEVDDVRRVEVAASGLVVARILSVAPMDHSPGLHLVRLNIGQDREVDTVSAALTLPVGFNVVYAPPGASVKQTGTIRPSTVAGKNSVGMILSGESLGVELALRDAIFTEPGLAPGSPLPSELFDDWVIEVDNKSITHRPDLWGHYGVAREVAAMLGRPFKPYPVVALDELKPASLPEAAIIIADPKACRRYCGMVLEGVPTQAAPLWMQLRLGHIGLRPISGLVDLTNYVMVDLGQPMHAFDAKKVDRIEVDWAASGESFKTLDGMERRLTSDTLMIKCRGRCIGIAGVMGGLDTEVTPSTTSLLLESANFEPSTIRKTAGRLGLRTDASARFEKSLDPSHAVLAIQRFMYLARAMYPRLRCASRLSDAQANPFPSIEVKVSPRRAARMIGREVSRERASELLSPLGFSVKGDDGDWRVQAPSFRATNDISIEVDVIEELARLIGYDRIEPDLPRVFMRRFAPNRMHELERRTLEYFTGVYGFNEIHGYLWYDTSWLEQLGVDPGPCLELSNPAADGLHRLRRSLMPGMFAAVVKNRFHFSSLSLMEVGSVFDPEGDREHRHVAVVLAQRGKRLDDELYGRLKGALEGWVGWLFGRTADFAPAAANADQRWEHPSRLATISVDGRIAGRISVVDLPLRRAMDEHLTTWGMAWAEVRLDEWLMVEPVVEPLNTIPAFPLVDLDFSFLVPRSTRYREVVGRLGGFQHLLLRRIRYVGSFEGENLDEDRRSLTVRTILGDERRTLTEADAQEFRAAFEGFLVKCGYGVRR